MNKRTELKKRNAELYLKKNIFSGKYIVRNVLAGTIAVTVVATGVGVIGAVADKIETRPIQKAVKAQETTEASADITFDSIPQLDESSISVLLSDLGENGDIDIESREKNMVTYAPGEFDKKFVGIEDDVNVHSDASEDADVVGAIYKGVVGDIESSDGEWVSITSGDVTGYVKSEYILSGDEAAEYASDYYTVVGTVNDDGVYVRSEADKNSEYVATADLGDTYQVEDLSTVEDDWVCVQVSEDITGYIYSEFVDVEGAYPEAVVKGELPEATGSISEVKADASDEEATGEITETKAATKNDKKQETTEAAATTQATTTEAPATTASAATQVTTTARGSISLTESDIYLMAAVLTYECGGESYEGQLAVANVILNRLQSGAYGSTVSDVVYAANQFSVVGTSAFNSCVANGSAQASCVQAVREACAGTNNIGSYKYFRTTSSANVSSYSSYTVIGNHVFY